MTRKTCYMYSYYTTKNYRSPNQAMMIQDQESCQVDMTKDGAGKPWAMEAADVDANFHCGARFENHEFG